MLRSNDKSILYASKIERRQTVAAFHSSEVETIQARPDSPMGMQFLKVPRISASVSSQTRDLTTRSCDETSDDGKSKLDCIDDED